MKSDSEQSLFCRRCYFLTWEILNRLIFKKLSAPMFCLVNL